MDERKMNEQIEEKDNNRKDIVAKAKKTKRAIMWAVGIGVSSILLIALGIKNKDVISAAWATAKEEIKKGKIFSSKWFKNASPEELYEAMEIVHEAHMNPEIDQDFRSLCLNLQRRIEKEIYERQTMGKEVGFPVHREHGLYLLDKD